MTITLRPYQVKGEDDIRAEYSAGARSVLFVSPTGSGKTVLFSDMAAKADRKGITVGIVAHRAEILDQIGRSLANFGVNHGYMAPGFPPNPLASVQVCSVQAMARRIDRYVNKPLDFLIIDEAHHAAAGTAFHAVINAHRKKRILGVTATPQRLSGEALSVSFDRMVLGPTVAELMSMGALTRYRLFAPFTPDTSGLTRRGGDIAQAENANLMDKPTITGNAVEHYKRLAMGKRAVVFCASVEHAEHVAMEFDRAGIKAASLDGKMDRGERRAILHRFAAGAVPILTSCDIVSEGFDVPAIEVAILLRPTESLALYLQQVGRALRPFPGKEYALILDHAGNAARHGLPDDERQWSLEGGKAKKAAAGGGSSVTTCGQCWASFRPSAPCCPYCGNVRDVHGRQIAVVEGTLEEIDPDLVRQARAEEMARVNAERADRIAKAWTLEDLAKLAVEFRHDVGWLFHRWKARGHPKFQYGQAVKAMAEARIQMEKTNA